MKAGKLEKGRLFELTYDTFYGYHILMAWDVRIDDRIRKRIARLPQKVRRSVKTLVLEIESSGPVRGNWSNYSKLGKNRHH